MNEHTVRKHIWQLKKYELLQSAACGEALEGAGKPRMTACNAGCVAPFGVGQSPCPLPAGTRPDLGGLFPIVLERRISLLALFKG